MFCFGSVPTGPVGLGPGRGSVVDNTEVRGPINLEEFIFPPAPPLKVSGSSTRHLLVALETIAATYGPKERALSMVTP